MQQEDRSQPKAGLQGERTGTITYLDFPPLPVTSRTQPSDELRCPESFRLAHESAADGSAGVDHGDGGFWAESRSGMSRVFLQRGSQKLVGLASKDAPVLIIGPKGSGKRELALAICCHEINNRRSKPFGEVDCEESQSADAIGTEIFGEGEGEGQRAGRLVACDSGTVLVRNLDRLPAECGRRLVHFLRHGEVRPLNSDRSREGIDVRVLATTRDESLLPDNLIEEFGERVSLSPLREMKGAISLILAEFFRPFDVVKEVHLRRLLDLLCYDWPGNIGELLRYCKKAKDRAGQMGCSILSAQIQPIARADLDSAPRVRPEQIVSGLLAFSEKRFRSTGDWPRRTKVPFATSNSLRLLAQLLEDRRDRFGRERSHPYYFHPYRIPLALFFDGCHCPPCYEVEGLLPGEQGPPCCLDEFLRKVADIVASPAVLSEDDEFRRAFGAAPDTIAAAKPSESFVSWIGSLKASIPRYEDMGRGIGIPETTVPTPPRTARTHSQRGALEAGHPRKDSGAFLKKLRIDPDKFRWPDLKIYFHRLDDRVTFNYGGVPSGPWSLTDLEGIRDEKSKRRLKKEGFLFKQLLRAASTEFKLDEVQKWCDTSRASASERVRCLNHALWRLLFGKAVPPEKRRRAIEPMRRAQCFRIMFSLFDARASLHGDEMVTRLSRVATRTRHPRSGAVTDAERDDASDAPEDVGEFLRERTASGYDGSAARDDGLTIR